MLFASLELFVRNGASVHCIVNDWDNDAVVKEVEAIGATWSTGHHRHSLRLKNRSPMEVFQGVASTFETSRRMLREATRFSPDLIFASEFGEVLRNFAALLALRAKNIPVVLYMQNSAPETGKYKRVFSLAIDPLVTRYVVASQHSKRLLAGLGIKSSKISYVNNFATSTNDASVTTRDPKKIVFAGQLIPQKGLDILLDAFSLVLASEPSATLEIAARTDGWIAPEYESYRDQVLSRVKRDDLKGRATLLGWRSDIPQLLQSAAVHCAPSRPEMHEGMPLVVLEAKNAATPTVAPEFGPFEELIEDRVNGWLCGDLNAQALAEGILYFLSDATVARKAGEAAKSSAAQFDRDTFEKRWADALLAIGSR